LKSILIKNTLLITLDDNRPDYFNGDILLDHGLIAEICEAPASVDPQRADHIIDGSHLIVMPGLINTHGHAAMTLFRSFADDLPLKEWLEDKIWPIEEYLTADDVYWGTMLAIAEMIKGGTTTFTDMYFYMEKVAEATAESGIRAVLSRGMIGFGDSAAQGLRETEQFINNWQGREEGRINVYLGPHAPYTCPPEYLKKVMALAEKTSRPLQIHLSETKREVEESIRNFGKSPVELVYELGLFNYPVTAAHCVHLSDRDLEILADRQVGVAHNPGSNLKLGSGIARVTDMLEKGISVGIGTDGAASNNNLDMIEEIRLVALLEKGIKMDPTLVEAKTALKMATSIGASALNLKEIGILKVGFKADLIGISRNHPNLMPMHNPLAHIVYAAAAADVEYVVVNGNILLNKGELTGIDEEKIMYEASKHAERLVIENKGKQDE